jgi:hypothetical protein
MKRTRKSLLVGIAVASTVGLGASLALAATDTDDHYGKLATKVTGKAIVSSAETSRCTINNVAPPAGTVTCFSVPGSAPTLTVYCKRSIAGGTTPSSATAGLAPFAISPLPVFDNGPKTGGGTLPCTDNLGGTEINKVQQGINGHTWTIQELDGDGTAGETAAEPNSTGDRLSVRVPQHGVIVTTSQGCQIVVAPGGDYNAVGTYNDSFQFNVALTNLPVTITKLKTSCPLPAITTTTTFKAFYNFYLGTTTTLAGLHDVS